MQHLSASKLAFFTSLLKKKYRRESGLTWVEGHKVVIEALNSDWHIHSLILTQKALENVPLALPEPIWLASPNQFSRLSEMKSPDGWGAVVHIPMLYNRLPLSGERGLILQSISDPGNLGTLIRLADWFGLDGIWMDERSVDPYSPKVLRASMGSSFRIPVRKLVSLGLLLEDTQYRIIAADLEGVSLGPERIEPLPELILLGSESHGLKLSSIQRKKLKVVCIPRFGKAESLNVASAAAILCWSIWGQWDSNKEGVSGRFFLPK
jgi:TrmH family RNA methyltransferase